MRKNPETAILLVIGMTVIISYRREDTGAITGRICDRLRARFGAESVYMDIDSNPIGVDYRAHIDESLKRCDILLAVIGRHWLGTGEVGSRRIDDPSDLVRLEVASALARGVRVVPLLIDNTEMPLPKEMPVEMSGLKYRQAFRVDSGVDFHHHLDRLCAAIAATALHAADVTDPPPPVPLNEAPAAKERGELQDSAVRPPGSVASQRTADATDSPPPLPPPVSPPHKQSKPQDLGSTPQPVVSPKGESEQTSASRLAATALIFSGLAAFVALAVGGRPRADPGSISFSLISLSIPAIICGHLAINRILRNPSLSGNGLAMTGLIVGYCELLWGILAMIVAITRD